MPGYSDILPKDVSLTSRLTCGITLDIPLTAAAMDTVTESRLAIERITPQLIFKWFL